MSSFAKKPRTPTPEPARTEKKEKKRETSMVELWTNIPKARRPYVATLGAVLVVLLGIFALGTTLDRLVTGIIILFMALGVVGVIVTPLTLYGPRTPFKAVFRGVAIVLVLVGALAFYEAYSKAVCIDTAIGLRGKDTNIDTKAALARCYW